MSREQRMFWQKLNFECSAESANELAEHLEIMGAQSVCFQDQANQPLYEPRPDTSQLWQWTVVSALFSDDTDLPQVLDQLREFGVELPPYNIEHLADRKWERQWMHNFHPMRFGSRLRVCPSNHSVAAEAGLQDIALDPGLAFGTGTHATTRLCLEWLADHFTEAQVVVDYGCGSGILSLAAAKLGARQVWAVDTDPQALHATATNAQANALSERITVLAPQQLPPLDTDLLLANILLQPLIELAPTFTKLLKTQGQLIMSGIMSSQISALSQAYQAHFEFEPAKAIDPWACLSGQRHPQS